MSGFLSIPFATMAFFNAFSHRREFVLLAFVALLVTIGRLTYKSVSKFKITTCSEDERKSAYNYLAFPDRPPVPVIFYQVRVDLLGKGAVTNCCVRLISIQKGETVKWRGQAVELTFSPGEAADATSKTLNDEIPEYVDVVVLSAEGDILLGVKWRQWTYRPSLQEIFDGPGEYFITIALRGSSGATCRAVLRFLWSEWNTSALEVLNGTTTPLLNPDKNQPSNAIVNNQKLFSRR